MCLPELGRTAVPYLHGSQRESITAFHKSGPGRDMRALRGEMRNGGPSRFKHESMSQALTKQPAPTLSLCA